MRRSEGQGSPAPLPLRFERASDAFDTSDFDCGGEAGSLSSYLQSGYILRDQALDRPRGYYLVEGSAPQEMIVGYFTLAAGFLLTRNLPQDALPGVSDVLFGLPVVEIEMLARHKDRRGQGSGSVLLFEALQQCVLAAETIGATGVSLTAVTEEAHRLYGRFGFHDFDGVFNHHNRMFLPMSEARLITRTAEPGSL